MPHAIYINLPVRDVGAATRFYEALGFILNPDFSNDRASGMRWGDAVAVMLLDHAFYATFTDKTIIDARTQSGVLLCLPFESRDAVDDIHRRVREAGGRETRPAAGQGHMYGGAFDDPDGHTWETLFMSPPEGAHDAA